MRRALKITAWLLGVLILIPVLAVAGVFAALNTGPGRSQAESLIASLTGGTVKVTGLSGRFPDQLRLAHVELADKDGVWLEADDIALDWSPTALLHKQALVHRLTAQRFAMPRLPTSEPTVQPAGPSQPFTLPVRVTVDDLAVARAELGKPLLGTEATVALTGAADVQSLHTGTATLAIHPVGADPTASYTLVGSLADDAVQAKLHIEEAAHGLVARLASLPDLGPVKLDLVTDGPYSALVTALTLQAGPLAARANGTIDLVGNTLKVDVTAQAPAMVPAPGVSWQSVDLDAHVAGPFTAPDANGHLRLDRLEVAGASLRSLTATLAGNAGQATVEATLDGLRIPGPKPDLLEAAPIQLTAKAQLDDPKRPVRFTVAHPLLDAKGTAVTAGDPSATVVLRLPDLAPIGAIAGLDLAGRTELTLRTTQTTAATSIDADGTLALTKGPGPRARLARHRRQAVAVRPPRRVGHHADETHARRGRGQHRRVGHQQACRARRDRQGRAAGAAPGRAHADRGRDARRPRHRPAQQPGRRGRDRRDRRRARYRPRTLARHREPQRPAVAARRPHHRRGHACRRPGQPRPRGRPHRGRRAQRHHPARRLAQPARRGRAHPAGRRHPPARQGRPAHDPARGPPPPARPARRRQRHRHRRARPPIPRPSTPSSRASPTRPTASARPRSRRACRTRSAGRRWTPRWLPAASTRRA